MRNHFVVKLTDGDGPPPLREMGYLLHQAGISEAKTAWLGTKKAGTTWRPAPSGFPSIALVIHVEPSGAVEAIAAKIIGRRGLIPPVPAVRQFYGEHAEAMKGWWELAEPERFRFPSLGDLPGASIAGLAGDQSFQGQATFAYWTFDFFHAFSAAITPPATWPPQAGLPEFFELEPYGDVRFTGHRINAYNVFSLFRAGQSSKGVAAEFPTLPPVLIEEALIYYRSNRSAIDPYLDRYREHLDFLQASSKPAPSLDELRTRKARKIAEEAR